MSELEGEGKSSEVRKESQGGSPKVQGVRELGDHRLGESQGGGQGCQGQRVPTCSSQSSTSTQQPLPKDEVLFPSMSLTLPPPNPGSLWGRPPSLPRGWSAYPLLLKLDGIWRACVVK